ncbi:MAG: hypothetical protein LBL00_07825 [Endomicrobium sp.]|jgi:hypothetical protein|nr:hypothetical protein [Endomicrobium sp.]
MAKALNLRKLAAFEKWDVVTVNTIETMSQENPILEDILWLQENTPNGYKHRERAVLPTVIARKYNQGIETSVNGVKTVIDPRTELLSKLELDNSYLEDFDDAAEALADEQEAYRTANGQKLGAALFYGTRGKESLYGFAPRYNTLNPAISTSKYIIDASVGISSPSNLASIWMIAWGKRTVHGFYPRKSKAGLIEEPLQDNPNVAGENGGTLPGKTQYFKWKAGLAVEDFRSVVRIANIDTVKAATLNVGASNVPDLEALLIKAFRLIKAKGATIVCYANQDVMSALDLQALGRYKQSYPIKEFAGGLLTFVKGNIPVRQQDCLLSTEELVTA